MTTDVIQGKVEEALEMIKQMNERELAKQKKEEMGGANPLDKPCDVSAYNRWIELVGPFGQCGEIGLKGYLVKQTREEDGSYKVTAESEADAETVS